MSDLISRQAAINEIKSLFLNVPYSEKNIALSMALTKIRQLPSAQPEPHWIPVEERLPKAYEDCLWTTTDGRVVLYYCDGMFSKYTAWMPLPEPYKGEQDEKMQ